MGSPARQANMVRAGMTASEAMDCIDTMIQSSPNKAEAERRLKAVIGHADSRLSHLSSYWRLLREDKAETKTECDCDPYDMYCPHM